MVSSTFSQFLLDTMGSLREYFDASNARKTALDGLFSQFNVEHVATSPTLKWVSIDRNTRAIEAQGEGWRKEAQVQVAVNSTESFVV